MDVFTKEEVMLTKCTVKAKMSVEMLNERLKNIILNRVIPLNLRQIASQMVYVASYLVNFQECLYI